MSETTHDAVRRISDASAKQRPELINDFLRVRQGLFRQIGVGLCRRLGVNPTLHADDFTQLVALEAYKMLTEQLDNEDALMAVMNWEGMLRNRVRNAAHKYADTNIAPVSETASISRRRRMLSQTRDMLRLEMDREPSNKEVVDRHNANMNQTRVNPIKQGVIASESDLSFSRSTADIGDFDMAAPIDPDYVLHPTEGPRFIKAVVKAATDHSANLGEAAIMWLSGLYRADGEAKMGAVADISAAMDVSLSTARSYVQRIRQLAMKVAMDQFGITENDI